MRESKNHCEFVSFSLWTSFHSSVGLQVLHLRSVGIIFVKRKLEAVSQKYSLRWFKIQCNMFRL